MHIPTKVPSLILEQSLIPLAFWIESLLLSFYILCTWLGRSHIISFNRYIFKETLALFFEAVAIQARARDSDVIPDLESYIDVRRDTSGM